MTRYDIIETHTIVDNETTFDIRLLKRGDNDWGVDSTRMTNQTFGYTEESARWVYQKVIQTWQ